MGRNHGRFFLNNDNVLFFALRCVGSKEIPGVTGKFGLEVKNEAGQRLIEFGQENTLVTANTLFQLYYSCIYSKYFHFNVKEI